MLNWDDLRHLAALANAGTLSGAARELKVEHATVSRRIASLEATLGVRLVDRRGGRYLLTAAGLRAVEEAQKMEVAARAVENLGFAAERPVTFTVAAPPTIASDLIVPRLPEFLAGAPGISITLRAESRNVSLTKGEADVALRLSRPDVPTLTVRRVGRLEYGLFAAQAYLAARDEADYAFVGLETDMAGLPQQVWLERLAGARPIAFRSNDLALICAAVAAGMGIAALPLFLGQARGLVRVETSQRASRDV